MHGDPEIIDLLNEVLTAELTAINQYFIHAKMCENWGYHRLASHGRDESIDEMKHAEIVIDRILYFDGVPNMQRLFPVRVGETVAEQLQLDLEVEYAAVERLNNGIAARRRQGRQRHPRAARRDPRVRGGPHRLDRDPAGDDPPDRARAVPRPAAPRLTSRAEQSGGFAALAFRRDMMTGRGSDRTSSKGGHHVEISVTVNGTAHTHDVEPRTLLVHYIREQVGLTGTNIGCDTSSCGACTIHIDGESVKSCTVLAVQADGADITTIEGLATDGELHPMQQAFMENHGLQCGYCTPGMVMAATSLLAGEPPPDRARGAHRAGGQPLPLHRLPQHRAGGPRRGRRLTGVAPMTTTEVAPAAVHRPAPAAPRGPRAAHRRGEVHQRPRRPRRAAPGGGAQPVRPRPHHRASTRRRPPPCPASSPCTPAPTWPTCGRPRCPAPGRSPRT